MFGTRAKAERRRQAEADRLFALADELAKQEDGRPSAWREITAERAARIRRELGKDLARDVHVQAAESELQGAGGLDAEIDRLAEAFPEPAGAPEQREAQAGAAPDYYRSSPGRVEHRTAYIEAFTAAAGAGYAVPDVDMSYEIDNADELARERYYEEQAEHHYRELAKQQAEAQGPCTECGQAAGDWHDTGCRNDPALTGFYMLGPEPGEDAARWSPDVAGAGQAGAEQEQADRDLFIRRSELPSGPFAVEQEILTRWERDGVPPKPQPDPQADPWAWPASGQAEGQPEAGR